MLRLSMMVEREGGDQEGVAEDEEQEEETAGDEGEEDLEDGSGKPFEIRVFRIALPMTSKNSVEVTNTATEMILRLRADGYNVN